MADIFLSYHSAERELAKRLARELEAQGWSVWWDERIRASAPIWDILTRELEAARCVVLLLSGSSFDPPWVLSETLSPLESQKPIISFFRQDSASVPEVFSHRSLFPLDEHDLSSAVRLIHEVLDRAGPAASAPAARPRRSARLSEEAPQRPVPQAAVEPIHLGVSSPATLSPIWSTVRTYFFDGSGRPDVEADANALRQKEGEDRSFADATGVGVPPGTKITVTLTIPDGECVPERRQFTWGDHWRKEDFAVRYAGTLRQEGAAGEGQATWFAGPLCVGEVPFKFTYSTKRGPAAAPQAASFGRGFESVFLSYAHKDSFIADWIESANALGIRYLRDTRDVRSGEVWDERLKELIRQADLFQLCWSDYAKQSKFVGEEWCYALGLKRPKFVRPCYWEDPMAPPPDELEKLHFQKLHPDWLTRIRFRLRRLLGE